MHSPTISIQFLPSPEFLLNPSRIEKWKGKDITMDTGLGVTWQLTLVGEF